MKYIPYIFENQDVQAQVEFNEPLVELAARNVINYNIALESYIYENLGQFALPSPNVADIYTSIRNFVISENTALYSQLSEILADTYLSPDEKARCLTEGNLVDKGLGLVKSLKNGIAALDNGADSHVIAGVKRAERAAAELAARQNESLRNTFHHQTSAETLAAAAAERAARQNEALRDLFPRQTGTVTDVVSDTANGTSHLLRNLGLGAGGVGLVGTGSYAVDQHFNNGGYTDRIKSMLPGHTDQAGSGANLTPSPLAAADLHPMTDPGYADKIRAMGTDAVRQAQYKGAAAMDFAKSQANSLQNAALDHPLAAAGIGLGAAGLGAYGAYRAMKRRK